jgi:hypothetical protein
MVLWLEAYHPPHMTLGPVMAGEHPVGMKELKPCLPSALVDAETLADAASAARYWGGIAIATLAQIAGDPAAPATARVAAAAKILERGFGPVVQFKGRTYDFSHISDEKLDEMLRRIEKPDQDLR